jgi:hypothetical protein
VGGGEAVDPLGRGGEQDVMTGLAGSMAITIAKNAAADVRTSFRATHPAVIPARRHKRISAANGCGGQFRPRRRASP